MPLTVGHIANGIQVVWILENYSGGTVESDAFQLGNPFFYFLTYTSNTLHLQLSVAANPLKAKIEMIAVNDLDDKLAKITVKRNNTEQQVFVKEKSHQWQPIYWSYISCPIKFVINAIFEPQTGGENFILKGLGLLLQNEKFADIHFIVKNEKILGNKAILAAVSPVFAAAFEGNWKEGQVHVMEIQDTEPEIFQHFLKFLYTGKIPDLMEEELTEGLCILADKYQVEYLKNVSVEWICRLITVENALHFLKFSEKYSFRRLNQFILKFIVANSQLIIGLSEWKEFVHENPDLAINIFETIATNLQCI